MVKCQFQIYYYLAQDKMSAMTAIINVFLGVLINAWFKHGKTGLMLERKMQTYAICRYDIKFYGINRKNKQRAKEKRLRKMLKMPSLISFPYNI